ncbi:MAG: protein phosphatase 2C domain-containing protein [Betaproteobacteria bacterium]|nr:protein phosphatase 2C domain-containing protein [Betaproteobacteria bacterium]
MKLRLDACIAQHQGDRQEQQDRLTLLGHPRLSGVALAAVADGMGGHTGGALAAEQVVHTLINNFRQWHGEDPHGILNESFMEAHAMIKTSRFINEKDPHSTVVALILKPPSVFFGHCGDSRMYFFQGDAMHSHTRDHSWIEFMVQQGRMSKEVADHHPHRNILMTSLGGVDDPQVDFGVVEKLEDGDAFLLCSDGLWEYFASDELGRIIMEGSAQEVSGKLIQMARVRAAGKGDNVSIALLKFHKAACQ